MWGGVYEKVYIGLTKRGVYENLLAIAGGVIVNLPLKEGGSTKKIHILTNFDPSPPPISNERSLKGSHTEEGMLWTASPDGLVATLVLLTKSGNRHRELI